MRRTPIHIMMLFTAMAAALTGCSRIPTAPSTQTAAAASAAVAPGSAPVVVGQLDDPNPPGTLGGGGYGTVTLAVGEPGFVQSGIFTLVIHKNSLKMPATIKMVQPDPNVMQVQFEVTPAAANDFQVPVRLVADCSSQSLDTVRSETTYSWDGQWTEAPKQSVSRNDYVIIAGCKSLVNAKIDLKPAKNTMSN